MSVIIRCPDLKGTIEYTATDFKNGDTKDVFVKDADFVAPKLYYMDENQNSQEFTSDKRAMETMQLIPDGGSSHDYEFSYAAGELEVKHHVLRDGYVIEGKKVKGYDWYVSDYVAIPPRRIIKLEFGSSRFFRFPDTVDFRGWADKRCREKFLCYEYTDG